MKCCDVTAGMLKTAVAFERMGAATNTNGDVLPGAWAAITGAPTRGMVKAVSGYEQAQVNRTDAQTALRVVVRYFAGLTEADSVVIRARRHNITFIDNVEFADKWLALSITGGVAV